MPFVAQPNEKCTGCSKTVYATEKVIVETAEGAKNPYHKTCIRCTSCNKVLALGELVSQEAKFYCKPHWKQLFAVKGNYDEGFGKEKAAAPSGSYAPPPSSFVPISGGSAAGGSEKKETSQATLDKFRKFREEGDTNKCTVCTKTVYATEKLVLEDKNEKRTIHKNCFKCCVCTYGLTLETYGAVEGRLYCKTHLKEATAQKLAAVNEEKKTTPAVAPTSFVPVSGSDEKKTEKGQTPDHISAKFRSFVDTTEKCKACGKRVYANEKLVIGELKAQSIFHKACFKCSHCGIQVDVHNYGSAGGVIYCKVHLKTVAKVEQVKGEYFISPLAQQDPTYKSTADVIESTSESGRGGDESSQPAHREESEEHHQPQHDDYEEQPQRDEEPEEARRSDQEEEERIHASTSEVEAAPPAEEGRSSPAPESSDHIAQEPEEEADQRMLEIQKRREERQRKQEAEDRERELERERRKAEREARMRELQSDS